MAREQPISTREPQTFITREQPQMKEKEQIPPKKLISVRERLERIQNNKPEQRPKQPFTITTKKFVSKRSEEIRKEVYDTLHQDHNIQLPKEYKPQEKQVDLNIQKQDIIKQKPVKTAEKIDSLRNKKSVLEALKEVYK